MNATSLQTQPQVSQEVWKAVNQLNRSQIETILEEQACIQCYDSESTEEIREALAINIADGTIELSALDDLP